MRAHHLSGSLSQGLSTRSAEELYALHVILWQKKLESLLKALM